MRHRWIALVLAVVLLGALGLAGCKSDKATGTLKIGVPTLLSGSGAPMGEDIKAGIELAVKNINETGGVLGSQLEIIYTDLKDCSAEASTMAAQLMDKKGVVANFPGCFFGPAPVHAFGATDQPMFHGSASVELVQPVVDNMEEYRNVFQITSSESTYGPNAWDVMVNKTGYTFPNQKVALLGGDITYDMVIQQSFEDVAKANGWEIVLDDTYPYGTTEFGAQLAKIRAEKPAIIFGCLTSVDSAVAFMNQFLQNPTDSLIYIQWSPASPEFINLLGDKANGILWQTLVAYLPTVENQAWVEEFTQAYGREPGACWPALMEDTLNIWKLAVEDAGDATDYAAIETYIENLSQHPYAGRCGTYGMDAARHEGLSGDQWLPIHMYQIQNQTDCVIYLGTQAQQTQFQVPPWVGK